MRGRGFALGVRGHGSGEGERPGEDGEAYSAPEKREVTEKIKRACLTPVIKLKFCHQYYSANRFLLALLQQSLIPHPLR